MGYSLVNSDARPLEFSTGEVTGAVGDTVTVLPIVVAATALTELSIVTVLLGFAVFQVVWGLHYGVPISVEPMKALAALLIAGALSVDGLVAAGLLAGGVLLIAGTTGCIARVETLLGDPVVRGVQLGVALILLETGLRLGLENPALAAAATGVVVASAVLGYRQAGALAVLGFGGIIAAASVGMPGPTLPQIDLAIPATEAFTLGVAGATAGQLAMTVGNAAIATSLLLSEYFRTDVSADELTAGMGVMNLAAIPLGAIPMCHGSGGVAGKFAFGARTASANVILGGLYATMAVFAAGIVAAFPLPVLGVVLVVVALALGRTALSSDHRPLTIAVGALGLFVGVGAAFIAGIAMWRLRETAVVDAR